MLIHETTKAGTGLGVLFSLLSHSALVVSVIYFVQPMAPEPLPLGLDGVEIAWLPPKGEIPLGTTLAANTETPDETDSETEEQPQDQEAPPLESVAEENTIPAEQDSTSSVSAAAPPLESVDEVAAEPVPEPALEPAAALAAEPAPEQATGHGEPTESSPEASAFLSDPESDIPVESSDAATTANQDPTDADAESPSEAPEAVAGDLPAKQYVNEPTPIPADAQTAVEPAPGTERESDANASSTTTTAEVQGTFHDEAPSESLSASEEQLKELARETGEQGDIGTPWGKVTQEDPGSPSGVIRDASSLRQIPGNRPPNYPARDRLQKIEGIVVLLAYITPDGRVEKIQVERPAPSERMNANSVRAFAKYRFQPGQQGWVRQPYVFRLNGTIEQVPARLGSRRSLQ